MKMSIEGYRGERKGRGSRGREVVSCRSASGLERKWSRGRGEKNVGPFSAVREPRYRLLETLFWWGEGGRK